MKSRTSRALISLAALAAITAPLASHASDNPALDRCVQIFVQEVVPANHSVEIKREDIVASIKPLTASRSNVTLIARGEADSKLYGRASCVIDRSGILVGMYMYDPRPGQMGYGRPKILARNVDTTHGPRTASTDEMKPF